MKRLFEVNGEYFSDKKLAKKARGEPTRKGEPADPNVFGSKATPPAYKHQIHLGPDHWKKAA